VFSVGRGAIYRGGVDGWTTMVEGPFYLLSVWGSSVENVIAVGVANGGRGLILRYDGTSWAEMESGTQRSLSDVWGTSEHDVFAVGPAGIFHYDGRAWRPQFGYRMNDLRDVVGKAPDDVIAAGAVMLLHYDGVMWRYAATAAAYDVFESRDGSVMRLGLRDISLYER
jgi:hypothetical protein